MHVQYVFNASPVALQRQHIQNTFRMSDVSKKHPTFKYNKKRPFCIKVKW